jgi:hypothetical protein
MELRCPSQHSRLIHSPNSDLKSFASRKGKASERDFAVCKQNLGVNAPFLGFGKPSGAELYQAGQ